jgi:hypothetical protein
MLSVADAGATVAAPIPKAIAVAATAPVNLFIFTPVSLSVSTWRSTATGTRLIGGQTQTSVQFAGDQRDDDSSAAVNSLLLALGPN